MGEYNSTIESGSGEVRKDDSKLGKIPEIVRVGKSYFYEDKENSFEACVHPCPLDINILINNELVTIEEGSDIVDIDFYRESVDVARQSALKKLFVKDFERFMPTRSNAEVRRLIYKSARGLNRFMEAVEGGNLPRPMLVVGRTNNVMANLATKYLGFTDMYEVGNQLIGSELEGGNIKDLIEIETQNLISKFPVIADLINMDMNFKQGDEDKFNQKKEILVNRWKEDYSPEEKTNAIRNIVRLNYFKRKGDRFTEFKRLLGLDSFVPYINALENISVYLGFNYMMRSRLPIEGVIMNLKAHRSGMDTQIHYCISTFDNMKETFKSHFCNS